MNPEELTGVSDPVIPNKDAEVRELFPVRFEKDLMDFRPVPEYAGNEVEQAPKLSSAPASVVLPQSPTGLEDVSETDLVTPAQPSVAKGTRRTSTKPTESGTPNSSEGI